jgi:hypothetical protein
MKEIIEHLLTAPEHQLDSQMKSLIEKWGEPPTALQVLEVLDYCVHGSLASGFVVAVLNTLYDIRCRKEGTTHAEVEKLAEWRNKF